MEVKKELFENKDPVELMVGSPQGSSEDALLVRGKMTVLTLGGVKSIRK